MDTTDKSTYGKKFSLDVDIMSLGDVKTIGMVMVPKELARDVTKYAVIDEKWWYWSDEGASRYLTLTRRRDYGVFQRAQALLRESMNDITREVVSQFMAWGLGSTAGRVDFISLGPGDFEKEGLALQSYLRAHENVSEIPVRAVPVDMSLPLTYRAMTSASRAFKNRLSTGKLEFTPHLGDYTKFSKADFGTNEFRFYTGLTAIHNAQFPDILDTYRALMTDKSVMLLDVDATGDHDDEFILSSYKNPAIKRFFYTSLGLMQKGAMEGGAIRDHDESVIGDMSDYAKCTFDGGTIEPEIVTVRDMDDFRKKNHLPASMSTRLRISPDPMDKTIAILYRPRARAYPNPIVLGYSTRFNRSAFSQKLEKAGFEVISSWFNATLGTNSLYLVKLAST